MAALHLFSVFMLRVRRLGVYVCLRKKAGAGGLKSALSSCISVKATPASSKTPVPPPEQLGESNSPL